jgi:uncharacterized protein (DUF2336 family)
MRGLGNQKVVASRTLIVSGEQFDSFAGPPSSTALLNMSPQFALLKEVERAVADGARGRRSEILRRVTDLFIVGADLFSDPEIQLFDDVISQLAGEIERSALALLAMRLAPIAKAPPRTIRRLAFDDDVDIAAPVLSRSERLDELTLVENAKSKSQGHLLAISRRPTLSEAVTQVLVERGEGQVLISVANNRGAKFSNAGVSILVEKSKGNEELALQVADRPDMPTPLFRRLVQLASERVRMRLQTAYPERIKEIREVVGDVVIGLQVDVVEKSSESRPAASKNSVDATNTIGALAKANDLGEVAAGLSMLSGLPKSFVESAMQERRSETFLIIARAIGLSSATVKGIMRLRTEAELIPEHDIAQWLSRYERIAPNTAREIMAFYRNRRDGGSSHLSARHAD